MAQIPTVLGLLVCEQVIIEERTHNVTVVNGAELDRHRVRIG